MALKWIVRVMIGATLGAAPSCIADAVDAANSVRARGCRVGAPASLPLTVRAALDQAAQRLAQGNSLTTATSKSGYRAEKSASIHIRTPRHNDVASVLAARFCDTLGNPGFRDIGIFQRGDETWIVLAKPLTPPSPDAASADRVVQLINEARQHRRRCGGKRLSAAAPLRASAVLQRAALAHAQDMASGSYLDHRGSDGSLPADRVTRAGYSWIAVAENIAAGPSTAEEVVHGWLTSPGHCANLMSSRYSGTGVAYAFDPASEKGTYWVQVFAAPN